MSLVVIRDDVAVPGDCRGGVVGIGLFDGVHLGHQELIQRVRGLADAQRLPCGLVTFDRHPATVVRPDSAPRVLTTLRQRLELFASLGVDFVRVVSFDEARSLQSPMDFAATVLRDQVAATAVVVGEAFHFGLRRAGDAGSLAEAGRSMGFSLVVVPLAGAGTAGSAVSSSAVRALLAAGDVGAAAALMGRPHEIRGIVERGDQRGRLLGFPTANVAVGGDVMLPRDGVYAACYVTADGIERPAAVSIGRRPTFYESNGLLLVEAYLLDFDGDLYGQTAAVRTTHHVRGQERFASADELVAQMSRDVAAIRTLLR